MIKNKLNNIKYLTIGLILGISISISIFSFGAGLLKTIQATENSIKVKVNGQELNSSNYIIEGRTYLQARDIVNAVGKDITWDGVNGVVDIGDKVVAKNDEVKNDNIEISNADISSYISTQSIYEKHNSNEFSMFFKIDMSSGTKNMSLWYYKDQQQQNPQLIITIPNSEISMFKAKTYVSLSFYNEKILPLIIQNGH